MESFRLEKSSPGAPNREPSQDRLSHWKEGGQGIVFPDASRTFTVTYDANALNVIFPFVSLTAHEGRWEGLADEVEINLLAVGDHTPWANTVTLIGEEVFLGNKVETLYLPLVRR